MLFRNFFPGRARRQPGCVVLRDYFHSLNLLCARILALAAHRASVDAPTEQSRRDGTACSPARECRVAYGLEASPGGTAHPGAVPLQDRVLTQELKAHDSSVEKHFQERTAAPQIAPLGRDDKEEDGASRESSC
jgi:hypothetical protein